jgi:hypothetical protein
MYILGERMLMGMEETLIRKINTFDLIRRKRECYLMGLEERVRDVHKVYI